MVGMASSVVVAVVVAVAAVAAVVVVVVVVVVVAVVVSTKFLTRSLQATSSTVFSVSPTLTLVPAYSRAG